MSTTLGSERSKVLLRLHVGLVRIEADLCLLAISSTIVRDRLKATWAICRVATSGPVVEILWLVPRGQLAVIAAGREHIRVVILHGVVPVHAWTAATLRILVVVVLSSIYNDSFTLMASVEVII